MATQSLRRHGRAPTVGVALIATCVFAVAQWPLEAEQAQPPSTASARPCRARGTVTSGTTPLPGASVSAKVGGKVVALSSTDLEGSYTLALAPGSYAIHVELTAFASAERDVTVGAPPCDAAVDFVMPLASRAPGGALAPAPAVPPAAAPSPQPGGREGFAGGRGAGRFGGGASRFQSLTVTESSDAAGSTVESGLDAPLPGRGDDPAARLLPPGFSTDAPLESVAVSGSMVELDRAQMNDRIQALGRGDFGLAEGEQFGTASAATLAGAVGAAGQDGGRGGGRGGPGGGGPGGGFGGGLGGRVGGANRVQASATYTMGGSAFDAAPYSLRGEAPAQRDYLQQNFSTTIGGPLTIPHIYNGARRTTFNLTYTGARSGDLFDQYATVPSDAFRTGDFSASPVPILDPLTGQPFAGNKIPQDRLDPSALALLKFIPQATLSGDTRNYRRVATSQSTSDAFALRLTHSITAPPANGGRGGRGGAGGAGGARAGGAGQAGRGGPGGRGNFQQPLSVTMNATINYRRNDGDRLNVFSALSGTTKGSTLSVPVTVNARKGRSMHAFNASFNRTQSTTLNTFAFTQDVTGLAGIQGIATDPFDWGVPTLSFGSLTGLRDVTPSRRTDRSYSVGYTWSRPTGAHTYRAGASYSQQLNRTQSDANARGSYTFTGLYTANGQNVARGGGQDFADFLLGLPQQATRQYSVSVDNISTPIVIAGRQFSAFLQDDWRWKARWTINYGVQYDLIPPYTEANGHMVNLDAAPDFTAVSAVQAGQTGAYSGTFPAGLVNTDSNNLSPRVGVAWRANNRAVVRFGYGLTYNSGTYSTIARQLYQQPPFFQTGTSTGTLEDPLTLADAFADITPGTVTNNYGIAKDYQLGLIHQWNVDYSRELFRSWTMGATYIGTRGGHLDMLRAPNRGPDGLRIPDVQPFTWQSSDGSSYMNGVSLRLQKRQTKGVSGTATYTLSKSRDNTTATGGNATVAQDDQNLDAEWALSNFDRRHQFAGSLNVELPWGKNRIWLTNGGLLASVVGNWAMSANLSWQSGTPLTVRCSTCASDVAQGIGGTLRADYNGLPIYISDPTIDQYFDTAAFSVPVAGTFGSSARNVLTGPGSHQLNMQFTRDVALGGNRNVSVNVTATNVLNSVNFGSVDVNVNSPTFGQVLSVRSMRTVRANLRFRF